jgi:hypothetical protein
MEIPAEAFLIKEGLYVHETNFTALGQTYYQWELYSAEGYCFYDISMPQNVDENGNLLPEYERTYARYMSMPKDENHVENYIFSVPIQPGYGILDGDIEHEVM